jgi:septal ring factor EnvC (AmiA/AmiB activator)
MGKLLKHCSVFLVLLYFCFFATSVLAAEEVVVQQREITISQQELMQLSAIISESKASNELSLQALKEAKAELAESQNELAQSKAELQELQSELTLLSDRSKQATSDLQRANESLTKSSAEIKTKLLSQQRAIKQQRAIIYILLGAGAIYVIRQ